MIRRYHFAEDHLFDSAILGLVEDAHEVRTQSVIRHMVVDGREVDVVVLAENFGGSLRTFGFELKVERAREAIAQAEERAPSFHYFYVVLNLTPSNLLDSVGGKRLAKLVLSGIGVILRRPCLQIFLRAKFNPRPRWRPTTLPSWEGGDVIRS